MNVVVNGRPTQLDPETTVIDVLASLGRDASGRGLAVAVNSEVVPRSEWPHRALVEQDRVEVLAAVGGG